MQAGTLKKESIQPLSTLGTVAASWEVAGTRITRLMKRSMKKIMNRWLWQAGRGPNTDNQGVSSEVSLDGCHPSIVLASMAMTDHHLYQLMVLGKTEAFPELAECHQDAKLGMSHIVASSQHLACLAEKRPRKIWPSWSQITLSREVNFVGLVQGANFLYLLKGHGFRTAFYVTNFDQDISIIFSCMNLLSLFQHFKQSKW